MNLQIRNKWQRLSAAIFISFVLATVGYAQAIQSVAAGANPAAIQATIDLFRADLGANNGVGGSFVNGRREINWDGVAEGASAPNLLRPDFFNFNSPRGVMFSSTAGPDINGTIAQPFQVSSSTASGVPVRFGNINPTYTNEFQTFSAQRLFTTTAGSNVIEITFLIPQTAIPATVNGFGAVFTDVDTNGTRMQFYDAAGRILLTPNTAVPAADKGLSFQGVYWNDGTRISRVVITLGNASLSAANTDGVNGVDVVAMDDFIYGEPRALDHHSGDYDGDGTADLSVYRPSSGLWFVLNSGSNTFAATRFGLDGDIPVDGDFDGDRRSDITLYRPSSGTWFRLNSSNAAFSEVKFGIAGDKPVAADYDKDGKSDIAVWRPASGDYFILRSANDQFQQTHFGAPGDIPILAAGQ